MATITAPSRVSRRVTTPILLPESDMACWLTVMVDMGAVRDTCT